MKTNPGEGARMNSGITRGGLSRNSRRRSQIQVPEPSGKGRGGRGEILDFSFPTPPKRWIRNPTEKSWNRCGFKKGFLGWGVFGKGGNVGFSTAIALQKNKTKQKDKKTKKKRIKNWESSGNSGLRTADPAPRESQISQRSPGGRGRKKKKKQEEEGKKKKNKPGRG